MVQVVLKGRASRSLACAFCRAADADDACGCGAQYHRDCRLQLGSGRCATLGCQGARPSSPRPTESTLRCAFCEGPGADRACVCNTTYHAGCRDLLGEGRCARRECGDGVRCSFCRARGATQTCACGVAFHPGCRERAGRCAREGCRAPSRPPAPVVRRRPHATTSASLRRPVASGATPVVLDAREPSWVMDAAVVGALLGAVVGIVWALCSWHHASSLFAFEAAFVRTLAGAVGGVVLGVGVGVLRQVAR